MSSTKITKLKHVVTSVWIIGLLIAVPVILLVPDLFSKFRVTRVFEEPAHSQQPYHIYFQDLDNNSKTQRISALHDIYGQLNIQYFNDKGGMVNQINFGHQYHPGFPNLFFGDVNKNGFPEIYGFTLGNDSLFLNWTEPGTTYKNSYADRFITRIGTFKNGTINSSADRFFITDLDNDGDNEILFSVTAGHSKFPRRIFRIDSPEDPIKASVEMGINPYEMTLCDLNGDGRQEILAGSSAGCNLSDSLGNLTIDNRPYLLGFNCNLDTLFAPVPFSGGITNNTQVFVGDSGFVVFQFNKSLDPAQIVKVFHANYRGELKDSMKLESLGKRFSFKVFYKENSFMMYCGDKMVYLDNDLKIQKLRSIESSFQIYQNPGNGKNIPEYITRDLHSRKAVVYTGDFRHRVNLDLSGDSIMDFVFNTGRGPEYFIVQTYDNEYTCRFSQNPWYLVRYPLFVLIYLVSVLFIWLIQNIREKQLRARFEIQNQLRNMEVRYLRMQMDPHFMFNAFNSMALMLKTGSREEAYRTFIKFTRMVRSNFDFSDRFTRSLSEEMEVVQHYLEINKLRFREKLEYSINFSPEVPVHMLIPRMMLQIHVENALKHGLAKLEKCGILRIDIAKEENAVKVTIEDNGIGREKAARENGDSTRQGLKMLQAMYDRLNQQGKSKITQHFTDLTDAEGHPSGTRVEIQIPPDLKE